MNEFRGGKGEPAVGEYHRALLNAARDRAVADAEQEVCLAWAVELSRVGRMMRLGVESTQAACRAARTLLRDQQDAGDPARMVEAQQRVEEAEQQARQSVEAAEALLEVIGEEQELMARAAEERDLVAQANRIRLWSAWRALHPARPGGEG